MAGWEVPNIQANLITLKIECDSVLSDLEKAHSVETLDTVTSNQSGVGAIVSIVSNFKNHNVADRVNQLQTHVLNAQQYLNTHGIVLTSISNGEAIRNAESAEHSFWGNVIGGDTYTSLASYYTAAELSLKIREVTALRSQIETHLSALQSPPLIIDPYAYLESQVQNSNNRPADTFTDIRNPFSDYRPYRPHQEADPCCMLITAITCLVIFCAVVSVSSLNFNY
jgi:hypothetical protein